MHAGKKSGMPPGTVAPPFPNLKLLRFCSLIPLLLSFFHPKSYYATDLTNSRHFVDCPVAVLPIFNSSCKHIHVLRCFRVSWRVSHVHILSTLFTATAVKSSQVFQSALQELHEEIKSQCLMRIPISSSQIAS